MPTATLAQRSAIALGGLLLLASCRDKSITAYRIPKEPLEAAGAGPAEPATTQPSAAPAAQWANPPGWQVEAASGMRQGSFLVPNESGASADVSVVSFPGSGGDDLANMNRWRNQLKLAPITAGDLPGQLQELKTPMGTFEVTDIAGDPGEKGATRILGAWLRQSGNVWFVKMMGPSDLVERQKEVFAAFLQSIRFSSTPAAQGSPNTASASDGPMPDGSPQIQQQPPMGSTQVVSSQGASLHWSAPSDWIPKGSSSTRKGSYSIGGAEVAITAFPGDVGGVLANVNRWRGQAGLDPVDDAGLAAVTSSLDANGLHIVIADASAGQKPIVAAIVPWNGGTWFFKLMGAPADVEKAKPSFISFLQTIRTP